MIYLFDSTAVSDWMAEHSRIESRLTALAPTDRATTCSIVRGEILYGIGRLPPGQRRLRLEKRAAKAFDLLPCEPVPATAGDIYAQVRIEQEQKGLSLGTNDLWIAATTLALGATLVSRDSDFARIHGFPVEDWTR